MADSFGKMGAAHNSTAWTGRPSGAGSPIDAFYIWLRRRLYPSYECEQCVGREAWQGCYCAYYGAWSPGSGNVPTVARVARAVFRNRQRYICDVGEWSGV